MHTLADSPYYVKKYDVGATDYGDSPYADITIGHRDGFVIHVRIERPYCKEDSVTIETILP